jgi:hypothetical protein
MNKFTFQVGLFSFILIPQLCSGLELSLRPRFNTGVQFFEYSQDVFQFNSGLASGQISEVKFKDFTPFVSGGLTFFVDRFFIDSSVQFSFDGEDTVQSTNDFSFPTMGPVPASDINAGGENNVNFDRLEYSFSLGYAITDQIVAYAGYKRSHTQIDVPIQNRSKSVFTANNSVPNPFFSGPVTGRLDLDYEYDGAFIGGAYSQNIDAWFLHGALSANVAIAFMDGEVDVQFNDLKINNQPIKLDILNTGGLKGDTVGISARLTWNGLTAINGLTYLVGINGYHYEFDGIENSPNFSETVVRVDFGLSFTF